MCCDPNACRPRVLDCVQTVDGIVEQLENNIDAQALAAFQDFGTSDTVAAMHAALSSPDLLNAQCTEDCNNWSSTQGDIDETDCPTSSCRCQPIVQATVVGSGDRVCKSENRFVPGSTARLENDNRVVCSPSQTCPNSAQCISYEDFLDLQAQQDAQIGGEDDQTQDVAPQSDDGLSSVALAFVIAGSVLGLLLIVMLLIITYRRTRQEEDLLSDTEAGDPGTAYTEAAEL